MHEFEVLDFFMARDVELKGRQGIVLLVQKGVSVRGLLTGYLTMWIWLTNQNYDGFYFYSFKVKDLDTIWIFCIQMRP